MKVAGDHILSSQRESLAPGSLMTALSIYNVPFPLAPVSSVVLVIKFVARSFKYSCLVLVAIALNFSDL